jgi:D-amino-acid dehydrogenase
LQSLSAAEKSCEVLVIGAGIIGVAIALRLQQERRAVMLIDRERVAAQASRGNAGALAFSDILPLAAPGILRKAPRWLLDPLGPLAIRPSYLPQLAPWLLRFWRASGRDRVRASTAGRRR